VYDFNKAGHEYGMTDYPNSEDAWDHFIAYTPEAYEDYRQAEPDDQRQAKEDFGWGWLETYEPPAPDEG